MYVLNFQIKILSKSTWLTDSKLTHGIAHSVFQCNIFIGFSEEMDTLSRRVVYTKILTVISLHVQLYHGINLTIFA